MTVVVLDVAPAPVTRLRVPPSALCLPAEIVVLCVCVVVTFSVDNL